MQRILALALFLLLLAPTLVKSGYSLNYMINFSYYKEVLCANKNNPNMDCNGKCALKKELKAASKEKDASKEAFDFAQQLQLGTFTFPAHSILEFYLFEEGKSAFASFNEGSVKHPLLEIEHPPC
ncbi:MAG: hypothetical protein ACEQSL_05185 [Sediminibacterium sp.]